METEQPIIAKPAAQADIDFAASLLNGGASTEEVHGKLVERGLDPAIAAGVIRDWFVQAVYAEAVTLLNSGRSPKEVEQRLLEKGLEPDTAKAFIRSALAQGQEPQAQPTAGSGLFQLVGGIVVIAGVGLLIGNMTGFFPTFPFAGFITMTVGGFIAGAGQKSS